MIRFAILLLGLSAAAQTVTTLHGAGATFPAPIYAKWFSNFTRQNPNVEFVYDAVGSDAGIRRLLGGETDFGASEIPRLDSADKSSYLFFPSVIGAVVPVVNLPGIAGDIAFTPEALAGIFLGKIRKWNDPILQQANRGLHLPDLAITVVHRADGSGTSYTWSDYLSATNADWKAKVGASLNPQWPVGRGAEGNDGVAKMVKEFGGTIGYVEYIYALENHLSFGRIRNRKGEFIGASLDSIAAAVKELAVPQAEAGGSLLDAPGSGAYPVVSFTWFVVPARMQDDAKRFALANFLKWMLGAGQRQAAALGYLALPPAVVLQAHAALAMLQ